MIKKESFAISTLGIEVWCEDAPKGLYEDYMSWCKIKGDGWRAPTVEELGYLYLLKTIGLLGFGDFLYWSSEEPTNIVASDRGRHRLCMDFSLVSPYATAPFVVRAPIKNNSFDTMESFGFRAVRTIK